MSSSRILGSLAVLTLLSAVACGGAVAPDGTGSSSGGTSSSGSAPVTHPGNSPAPAPTSTGTTTPIGTPAPPSWSSTAQGCGDFQIYFPDATKERFILVQADKKALGLSQVGDSVTVDLATSTSSFVELDTYASPAVNPIYCNDAPTSEPTRQSKAWAGTATFTISGITNDTYQVDVTLHGVVVLQPDETYLTLPDLTFESVTVGWYAG